MRDMRLCGMGSWVGSVVGALLTGGLAAVLALILNWVRRPPWATSGRLITAILVCIVLGALAPLAIRLLDAGHPGTNTGSGATPTTQGSNQSDPSPPGTAAPGTTVSDNAAPDTEAQAPIPPPAPPPAKCINTDVSAAFIDFHATANGAAGLIQVTNISQRACTIDGYGGAEFYAAGDGRPLGINLVPDVPRPTAVTLQPGGIALKLLRWAPNAPDQYVPTCSAPPGIISVILPDDTHSNQIDVVDLNLPQVCDDNTVYGGGCQPG